MIAQLQKRLDRYIKQSDKNDKEYRDSQKSYEQYFESRFEIDKNINGIFQLQKKEGQRERIYRCTVGYLVWRER
ncbi:MAG TPA: hypothetical protein VIK78_19585 [Ruminiclostridium sp.]